MLKVHVVPRSGMRMRPNSVEIKVTLSGDQVEHAIKTLALPPDSSAWRIYFCEDVTQGIAPGTPLLDAGVVLRARDRAVGRDDSTVKLRPCRSSQLTDGWLNPHHTEDWEYKLEADWAGTRRVLAASLTAKRPRGRIAKVLCGEEPLQTLFTQEQEQFLSDSSESRVNLNALTVLPAVTATRWEPFRASATDPKLDIRAERWVLVDELDFLELSIVADVDDAEPRQAALEQFVRSHDLGLDPTNETKTRRVLEHLVTASTRLIGERGF
jgi:hypothetical protein